MCYFAADKYGCMMNCYSFVVVSSLTMLGTFMLATSNMAASAMALAVSCPISPLFDISSSTTLKEKENVVSL